MKNSSKYIIIALIFLFLGYGIAFKFNPNNQKKEIRINDTIDRISIYYDTIHKRDVITKIVYRDNFKTDTIKVIKYKDIDNNINGVFRLDGSDYYCSKPFIAIDSVKDKFKVEFRYPELLFDYDIYSSDTTKVRMITRNEILAVKWYQEDWFIYTTNAVSLITGVFIGSQARK